MEYSPPVRRIQQQGPDLGKYQPQPNLKFYTLDPNVRYLWILGRGFFWTIVFVVVVIFALVTMALSGAWKGYFLLGVTILAGLAVIHIFWPFISYRHWGFAMRESDFLIRSGVFWKRVTAIPFARIQHVDNSAGPLERAFHVANLIIHTAGAQMGSLTLPGLPEGYAESLRDYLSKVGHSHANI